MPPRGAPPILHAWGLEEPTDGGVSDEGLLVVDHGVHGELLCVVCRDDGDAGLLLRGDGGHLPHHLGMHQGKGGEIGDSSGRYVQWIRMNTILSIIRWYFDLQPSFFI